MNDKIIKYYKKIQLLLLCALALFPITPKGVQSTIIITLGVLALCYFFGFGRKTWTKKNTVWLLSLGSLNVIYFLSLLHLDHFTSADKMIIRTAPILLLSFIFLNLQNIKWGIEKLRIIILLYISAIFTLLLFLNFSFFEELQGILLNQWETRTKIEEAIGVHGTYLAMWIGFGILGLIWLLFRIVKIKILIISGVFVISYFFYWMYILGARMPFFATSVASLWLMLSLLRVSTKRISILFTLLFFLGLITFWSPIVKNFNELSNYNEAIPQGKYENTNPLISNEDIRSVIYYCAIEKIKQKQWFGYGIGDVNRQLQKCYDTEFGHTDLFTRFHFNAHSQYLQIFLALGLSGVLIFLTSIILWIKWSVGNDLYLPFLILVLLCFMFENVLSRHDGVVFFGLFNALLLFSKTRENNKYN